MPDSPPQPKGKPGVKPKKGPRQRKLTQHLTNRTTTWLSQKIAWYAGQKLKMDLLDGTALWHRDGEDPLPFRSRPLARSKWQALSLCPLLHGPHRFSAANHHMVRLSLEHRGHLSARRVPISGSKPGGSGVLQPSLAPLRACWGCSAWSSSWHTRCTQLISQPDRLPGIPKLNPPLPMLWPQFAAICGRSGIRQPSMHP
jgi:hypothetical protein